MSSTKTLRSEADTGELASLLAQLGEEKGRLERLLSRVDEVLSRAGASAKGRRTAESATKVPPPKRSPLDDMKAVVASTADLREANGNLSAARVAKVFGTSLSQLADWLGHSKQAVSKTPDADSLQPELAYFERVARLRMMMGGDAEFRKWLRMRHELLRDKSPLDLLAKGQWQVVVDYVEDALTGAPT
jgi:hypothetical protein